MNKGGIASKCIFSHTEEGTSMMQRVCYNTHTDHIGMNNMEFRALPSWSGIVNNKDCATYLGVTVAEQVLLKVFKNVDRMPYGNPGYDFICGRGYKIDVKSATKVKDWDAWHFHINQNHIADHFLCLAFDDRKNLNPQHIWLIPCENVNHLINLGISVSTIDKWAQYELSGKLDKVIACCNIMKKTVGVGRR